MAPGDTKQSWGKKFHVAVRGIALGIRDQSSFYVHLPVGIAAESQTNTITTLVSRLTLPAVRCWSFLFSVALSA